MTSKGVLHVCIVDWIIKITTIQLVFKYTYQPTRSPKFDFFFIFICLSVLMTRLFCLTKETTIRFDNIVGNLKKFTGDGAVKPARPGRGRGKV